jgi:hypothetical protein
MSRRARMLGVASCAVAAIGLGLVAPAQAGAPPAQGDWDAHLLVDPGAGIDLDVAKNHGKYKVRPFTLFDALLQCSNGSDHTESRIETMGLSDDIRTIDGAMKVNDKGKFKGSEIATDGNDTWVLRAKGKFDGEGVTGTVQFAGDSFDPMTKESTVCDTGIHNFTGHLD